MASAVFSGNTAWRNSPGEGASMIFQTPDKHKTEKRSWRFWRSRQIGKTKRIKSFWWYGLRGISRVLLTQTHDLHESRLLHASPMPPLVSMFQIFSCCCQQQNQQQNLLLRSSWEAESGEWFSGVNVWIMLKWNTSKRSCDKFPENYCLSLLYTAFRASFTIIHYFGFIACFNVFI